MIEFFRTTVKESLIFKIFLGILMASFGIWGIGDSITGGGLTPGTAIKVGSTEIKTAVVQRQFNRDLERFRQAMGGQNIPEDIMKRSVMSSTLQQMTRAATIDEAANSVGLSITEEQLREAIYQMQPFQVDGKFNRMQFEQLLSSNNLTESAYLQLFEADLRQVMLMQPVMVNAGAPDYLVESLFQFRNETRTADTLLIPAAAMSLSNVPKDEDLKAVYDKNIAEFTAPEYRKLTILSLTTGDLVKPESIDDAEAKAYYDDNLARYRTPEAKRIFQIVFDSKEKAEAARALAAPGEAIEALATKAKSGPAIDLGELPADSPLVKMIGADVYNAPVNDISQPVETPLGWHLLQIKSIAPESTKPFDAVKEEIRVTIAADKGADAVYDASVQIEDGLAAGAALPEIAKSVGGQILTIEAVDESGKAPNGLEAPNNIDPQNLLRAAFETPAGKDSRLMDLPSRDGYYVVHVDEVTPPTAKPILDVRARVVAIWEREERQKLTQELAEKVAAGALGPTSQLSRLEAADGRLSYAPLGPITRFGEGLDRRNVVDSKRLSTEVLDSMFKAKPGEMFVAQVQDGMLVARLKEVLPATPIGEQAEFQKQLAESLRNDIGSNLMDQVSKAFAERFPAEVDQPSIDNMIATR